MKNRFSKLALSLMLAGGLAAGTATAAHAQTFTIGAPGFSFGVNSSPYYYDSYGNPYYGNYGSYYGSPYYNNYYYGTPYYGHHYWRHWHRW